MITTPLPPGEDARLAALQEYGLLDTASEESYGDITRLAAFICGTPIAAITLVDAERQWFKYSVGLDVRQTPRDVAFCAHTILQPDLMVVPDAAQDIRFQDNPLVTGAPNVRFYAGMPLVTEGGHALGALCVIDTEPRHLTPEQSAAMKTLARQVTNQFELAHRVAAQERLMAEREQAADTLKMTELRYRRLFEAARDGILILDDKTAKITNANPFMGELLGHSQDYFLGKELWEIGLLKDNAASQEAFQQLQQEGYLRYKVLEIEVPGGKRRSVEVVSNVYPEGDRSVIQCNIRDITEQKAAQDALVASEQFAQATLNSLSAGIAILDGEGVILAVNHAWRQYAADSPPIPPYAAVGANYLQVCDAAVGQEREDAEGVAEGIRAVSAGERELFTLEYPCHSPEEQCWCNLRATPFPQNGQAAGDGQARVVVSHENVTQRKQADLLLEQTLELAQLQADHDPLTDLLNHRVFYERLEAEAARARREKMPLAVAMLDINNFKFFNEVYGHAAGDAVLRTVAVKLQAVCRSYDTVARFGGDEFALILPHVEHMTAGETESRLRADLEGLTYRTDDGQATIPITLSLGTALYTEFSANSQEVLRQADERLLLSKTGGGAEETARHVRNKEGSRVEGFSMMDALVTAVDNKDRYTRRHSEDVMEYSLMIMRQMGLDESGHHTVAVAALLHDVGKIGIPDHILRKPGKLTDKEFDAVKQHPTMGSVIMGAVPGLEETLDAVRHHHERWDGNGYPDGLKGLETPLTARLMAVADAYSAMTTDRPYRKGMDRQKALAILADGSGTQWDPKCVSAFLAAQGKVNGGISPPLPTSRPTDPA